MKKLKNKLQRKVKYFRVSMGQADKEDKQYFGLCALTLVVFLWWWFTIVM